MRNRDFEQGDGARIRCLRARVERGALNYDLEGAGLDAVARRRHRGRVVVLRRREGSGASVTWGPRCGRSEMGWASPPGRDGGRRERRDGIVAGSRGARAVAVMALVVLVLGGGCAVGRRLGKGKGLLGRLLAAMSTWPHRGAQVQDAVGADGRDRVERLGAAAMQRRLDRPRRQAAGACSSAA